MKITRYYPSFVEAPDEIEEVDVETAEELVAVPWVAKWEHVKLGTFLRFSRRSMFLVAEFMNGNNREWFIIGVFNQSDDYERFEFPVCQPKWKNGQIHYFS